MESAFKSVSLLDYILFVTDKTKTEVEEYLGTLFKHVDRKLLDATRDMHLYVCSRTDVVEV